MIDENTPVKTIPPWFQQEAEEQNAAHFGLEEVRMHSKYPFQGNHPMAGLTEENSNEEQQSS